MDLTLAILPIARSILAEIEHGKKVSNGRARAATKESYLKRTMISLNSSLTCQKTSSPSKMTSLISKTTILTKEASMTALWWECSWNGDLVAYGQPLRRPARPAR
jgi:hypothetical protein